jgi:tetratricopeptide (TPR) repeat protein
VIKTPTSLFLVKALLITSTAFWIFSPAFHGDWLWDDGLLIRNNGLIHDPAGLWKIWFEPGKLVDYLPITASVEWVEWHLWHENTLGYHLVNVLLHVLGALLVWRLFNKFNLRLAWLGGLLFAIHPVVVESVAWISELKNTLSLPFFLLSMCAWIDYDRLGKRKDYFRALGLFLVAMLCKATMVMFPVVILLYAWWRRNRIGWNDLKACAPFFAVSLVLGLVTLEFLHPAMGVKSVPLGGFTSRLALAGLSIAFYFSKCVLPLGLLPIYPKWIIAPPSLAQFLPWPILIGTIIWCWNNRITWGRHALLGLGFFLINLAPFVGFTQAAYMSFTWVMDHVLYLPLIGLIGLAMAACGQIDKKPPQSLRPLGIGTIVIVLALLAAESHGYAKIFISQENLWTYTLRGNPDSDVAHNNLGVAFLNSGQLPQAIEQFEAAVRIKPDYAYAHNGLGNALFLSGRAAEAIDHYREALRIDPSYPEAHNGLANALLQSGQLSDAKTESEKALKLNPNYPEAHCTLGLILARQGQVPEAIEQFETALRLNPVDARIGQVLDSLHGLQKDAAEKK